MAALERSRAGSTLEMAVDAGNILGIRILKENLGKVWDDMGNSAVAVGMKSLSDRVDMLKLLREMGARSDEVGAYLKVDHCAALEILTFFQK